MSDFLVGSALWLDLSTNTKVVLVSLCENADRESGYCFPSQEYIAQRCSLSVRRVRDHLAELEERGYVETASVGHGPGSITERYVNVDRIEREGRARHDVFRAKQEGQRLARRATQDARRIADVSSSYRPEPDASVRIKAVGASAISGGKPDAGVRIKPDVRARKADAVAGKADDRDIKSGHPTSDDPSGEQPEEQPEEQAVEPPVGACAPGTAAAAAADPDGDDGFSVEDREAAALAEVFGAAVEVLSRAGIAVSALLGEEVGAEIEAGATLEDFEAAAREAAVANVRQFRYVRTILRRLREERAEEPRTATAIVRTNPFERCDCGRIDRAHVRRVCAGLPPVPAALVGVTG